MTFKFYIDPGHGGHDPGASGYGEKEKDLVLEMSYRLKEFLRNNYEGITTNRSRGSDVFKSLDFRTNEANEWGADAFLSLHMNAFNGSASGYEDYVYPTVGSETRHLQDCIHDELASLYSGFPDRGKKEANYHVLRESLMPAVLTENLFIDHKQDNEFEIGRAHV